MSDDYYVSTYAGTGSSGYQNGAGYIGGVATFKLPAAIAVDNSGNVYVGDISNHVIRKIRASDSVVSTFAGNGSNDYTIRTGAPTSTVVGSVWHMLYDGSNNQIYFSSGGGGLGLLPLNGNNISLIVDADAFLFNIGGIALNDAKNTIYFTVNSNNGTGVTLGVYSLASTYWGRKVANYSSYSNPLVGMGATLLYTMDSAGALQYANSYLYVRGSTSILKINASTGSLSSTLSITLTSNIYQTMTLNKDNTYLYLIDAPDDGSSANDQGRIILYNLSNNTYTTIAGVADSNGYVDGSGSIAKFSYPLGITINNYNNYVYVADRYNHVIRRITTPIVCYLEGTKILCKIDGVETYVAIEHLKPGDLVQTLVNGYKAVKFTGSKKIINDPTSPTPDKLYIMKKEKHPSRLTEDLILTGRHPVLVTSLPNDHPQRTKTCGQWRHCAYLHPDFEVWEESGEKRIWHVVLDDPNPNRAYGIYVNGILSESIDENFFLQKFMIETGDYHNIDQ